ncbi:unnamed protein product [Lactuca virosa]|uniref:Uncharacterized protein n=1 Tax=Lactuca virosa TaxID=75947 RepID=A0AAU9LX05_9ASTR|nr:unnamed protein product [Lactuca virosa]
MGNDTRAVYLEMTAAEILSEGGELRLSRDVMERVLVDRRAYEGKKITNMKDKSVRAQMELVVNQAKYCRIHLGNPDMFADSQRDKSNVSPLLPLIFSEVSSSIDTFGGGSSGGASSPPGFLDELFRDSDYDSMETILKQLYEDLRGAVLKCSALGNFQQPLRALMYLISFPLLFPNPLDIRSQIVTPFFIFSIIELAISVASSPEGSGDEDEASRGRRCRWVSFAKRKGGVGDPEQNIDSLKETVEGDGVEGM